MTIIELLQEKGFELTGVSKSSSSAYFTKDGKSLRISDHAHKDDHYRTDEDGNEVTFYTATPDVDIVYRDIHYAYYSDVDEYMEICKKQVSDVRSEISDKDFSIDESECIDEFLKSKGIDYDYDLHGDGRFQIFLDNEYPEWDEDFYNFRQENYIDPQIEEEFECWKKEIEEKIESAKDYILSEISLKF